MGRPLTIEEREQRSAEHLGLARTLAEVKHEWAAVAYFYAAYHLVRAALLDDPTFDDLSSCQRKHVDLRPEDRHVGSHHGKPRKVPREFGVNDLVALLYPGVSATYERLHQLSIDVRYERGMKASIEDLQAVWDKFERLRTEGALTSATYPAET